jgi:hypothetical protein
VQVDNLGQYGILYLMTKNSEVWANSRVIRTMKTIDDLVHNAETESSVLRSVSHMTPVAMQDACQQVIS